MIVGYARTSTAEQAAGLAAQERDLRAQGAEKVFSEQVSSVEKRDALADCLAFLREGDVLTVTKPDRLARNTAELLTIQADLSGRQVEGPGVDGLLQPLAAALGLGQGPTTSTSSRFPEPA